jgi:O-antigen/teichoic acid export membrane protein/O-antigen ligase
MYRTLAALIAFGLSVVSYVLNFDISLIQHFREKKKIPFIIPSVILLLVFGFSAILTMLINKETNFLVTYGYYGIIILASFFIVRTYSFSAFKKIFIETLFILSVISLFFYVIIKLSGTQFGISTFTNGVNSIYANYFFIYFQNIYLDRIQSVFWEPGLYSSFLLIALAFEIIDSKKLRYKYLIVFIICILLTKSTFAYIAMIFIIIIFLNRIIRKQKYRVIVFAAFLALFLLVFIFSDQIITILADLMPDVFKKIQEQNPSLLTRLISPQINWNVFLESPIIGSGFNGANILYQNIIIEFGLDEIIDAQTSTSFYMMGVFGFFGIIYTVGYIFGIMLNKDINPIDRFSLTFLFLLILNKEPHTSILVSWIFLFYFVKEAFDKKLIAEKYPVKRYETTVSTLLLGKGNTPVLAKNLFGTLIIKGLAIFISFFSVTVFSRFFNDDNAYGLWLALLSILSWIMTFDMGLGNGMKNKLIESFQKGTVERSKQIIVSCYISTLFISFALLIIGISLVFVIDLNSLFNIAETIISKNALRIVTIITLFGICSEFVLKNIIYIFHALQKQIFSGLFSLISTTSLLIFALIFRFDNVASQLYAVSIAYVMFYTLPYIVGSIIVFNKKLKAIKPKIADFKINVAKEIMGIGLLFFLAQISLLFLNSSNQILISNIYGPSVVVDYTKYTKLFNVVLSIFTIMCTALWAAIGKSFVSGNIKWIKKMNKNFLGVATIMTILCGLIVLFLQPIFNIWLGEATIMVDWLIALICWISVSIRFFTSLSSSISNGIQTLKTQIICLIIGAIVKIPLVYLITYLVEGIPWYLVIIVDIICYTPLLVILPIANKKKLNNASVELLKRKE